MCNQRYYVVVYSDGNRNVHGPFNGPFNPDDLDNVEILNLHDIKVLSELEYLENDRDYIVNNTGATD